MRSKNLIRTTTYSPRLDYILLEQLGYILLARLDYILREGSAEGSADGVRQRVRQMGFDRWGSAELCLTLEVRQRVDKGSEGVGQLA